MLPPHVQSEQNYLSAISNVISNLKKQHKEEMTQLQQHHAEVVTELKQQAIDAQQNYKETLSKANEQIKWARWAFYIALITLIINMVVNLILITK
ncbi:MAG: hypothetical protein J6X70_06825 [Muribaculaceae bacterium]|nr:hypothetical protein [Muribaculaceae bacterium]